MAQQFLFVANRDVVVTSTLGYSLRFEKGKPLHVPKAMHKEVMDRGILPVDSDGGMDVEAMDNITKEAEKGPRIVLAPETQDERDEHIRKAIMSIVERNNSADFTAGGVPSAASVSGALGWRVDLREIRRIWNDIKPEILGTKEQ